MQINGRINTSNTTGARPWRVIAMIIDNDDNILLSDQSPNHANHQPGSFDHLIYKIDVSTSPATGSWLTQDGCGIGAFLGSVDNSTKDGIKGMYIDTIRSYFYS